MKSDTLNHVANALAPRYDIGREVGSGGTAVVHLGHDRKHDRPVAIKILRSDFAAAVGAERFLAEIRVTASLQHPHVLTLIDSGEVDGRPYYVLPFVPGESLCELLARERRLSLDIALDITAQVVSALAHAHSRGVVHRDVKPANILLEDGNAFLADFGVALALESSRGPRLTEAGMSVGTPEYMSPEQVRGDRVIDGRSDVYSLAAVLFEMLAGQPLFAGSSPFAIVAKVVTEGAPSVGSLRPDLPVHVVDAIDKALSKSPADRFATITEFGDALLRPTGNRTRARSGYALRTHLFDSRRTHNLSRRISLAVAGIAMVLATIAAARHSGVSERWFGSGVPSVHQRVAVLFSRARTGDAELEAITNGLMGDLIDSLQHVSSLQVVPFSRMTPYRNGLTPADSVARALSAGAIVQASVERTDANFRISVWLVEAATGVRSATRTMEASVVDLLPIRSELTRTVVALLTEKPRAPQGATSTQAWLLLQRARDLERRVDSLPRGQATAALVSADSMLDAAERIESAWPALILERGQVAYRQSHLVDASSTDSTSVAARVDAAQRAIRSADRVLSIEPLNAAAYALRGTARFWIFLGRNAAKPAPNDQQLLTARFDLERAVDLDTKLASAWTALTHLYSVAGYGGAYHAAQMAYAADPYVDGAGNILLRLFLSAYDGELFAQADSACAELRRRFPSDIRAVRCRLIVLTEPTTKSPDVAEAWRLADSLVALTPDSSRDRSRRTATMRVAAVIARTAAGQPTLADSARRVADRARQGAIDPQRELANQSAFVHTLLGDNKTAIDLLIEVADANPNYARWMARSPYWWFRELKADSGFRRLVERVR